MENDEESYILTPKGIICRYVDDKTANEIVDALELFMRRNNLGIVVEDFPVFRQLEWVDDK